MRRGCSLRRIRCQGAARLCPLPAPRAATLHHVACHFQRACPMNERAQRLRDQLIRNFDDLPKERELRAPLYDTMCARLAQGTAAQALGMACLLYTSDAADERSSVDLGGR